MKRFLLIFCALCATAALWAATETVNGIEWTYRISDGKASIGDGLFAKRAISSSTSGSITIPSSLGGYPVTSIGSQAFGGCKSLTSVTIPSSVTSIGERAFDGCSGLAFVTIPEGVTSIGDWAFAGCSGLTSITIPSSVTEIGEGAFSRCPKLKVIVDSANQHYMTPRNGALLTKDMTKILHGPAKATSCTIPKGVTSIGAGAFSGYTDLTSVTIPPSVTEIGDSAFSDCDSLTSVKIPPSVTSIGDAAFCYCDSLTSVKIPPTVTSIGAGAFCDCSGLTSITIPSSVTSIGEGSFVGCTAMKEMIFKGPPPNVEPLSEEEKQFLEHKGVLNPETLPATKGYYLPEYAEAWENVLGGETGRWNNLQMEPISLR